ncbi:hypothetical protein M0804_015043 [Polistes exclamans]|nr:hypothetical protein M0804_015043 [Polistes exclamans]
MSNQFSKLQELKELPGKNKKDRKTPQPKPPLIHIKAQAIVPLIELLKQIAKDEYTLKQLKDNHVKVQVSTFIAYREITNALKEKNKTSISAKRRC